MKKSIKVGVIGGGLMGREVASAFSRWFVLGESTVKPELVAVADINQAALDWFRRVPSVSFLTNDYRELLEDTSIDVIYVAVPHDLHEHIYTAVLRAGKDLLAEKPFGIDAAAAYMIVEEANKNNRFVRCSSEFPFYPGAQKAFELVTQGELGEVLEVNAAFLHSSDMDLEKPINWKRQSKHCGEAGVMNDLGMHVVHMPLALGFSPKSVYAQLQNIVSHRPDGKGGRVACDTWDNATLHCSLQQGTPMRLETKRLAPGEMNTWSFEVLGTKRGVRFSTKSPKTLWSYGNGSWNASDIGHQSAFSVVTGGIFEFGFPDALLQMWASFLAERDGCLGGRFGCATPEMALDSHALWQAALLSHNNGTVEPVTRPRLEP